MVDADLARALAEIVALGENLFDQPARSGGFAQRFIVKHPRLARRLGIADRCGAQYGDSAQQIFGGLDRRHRTHRETRRAKRDAKVGGGEQARDFGRRGAHEPARGRNLGGRVEHQRLCRIGLAAQHQQARVGTQLPHRAHQNADPPGFILPADRPGVDDQRRVAGDT